uniref:rhomboid-related protein 4-like isoform X1 n=1 Tax=Ciona intestinalis TaxID=7719 RepID=UPI000180B340|nr:rhomboid-related protein 4-like isoform X1 [Ciona intestinalis]|eukprot:XP_009861857.1 rhomboid-related protein 4-like isoform X1 [Ciona intestinalis]
MWPGRSRRGMGGRGNMGLMLLLIQLCQAGFDNIPPVTLGTIALNVGVFLGFVHKFLNLPFPHPLQVCAGVAQVWKRRDYWRIVEATFHHGGDWHLYYNMISFLWKGRSLERKIGSKRFLYMIAVFSVLVNYVMLWLNYGAANVFRDGSYINQCAIGFSGVVFAVKVVTTQLMEPGTVLLLGFIPVNSRLSCWFELILIQVLVPNASFTGHLAGILVGLAYVKGPLKRIMEWPLLVFGRSNRRYVGPSYSGRARRSPSRNYESYTGGMDEEEQLRRATEESLQENNVDRIYPDLNQEFESPSAPPDDSQPPPYGWNLPDINHDELRRRRLERYT